MGHAESRAGAQRDISQVQLNDEGAVGGRFRLLAEAAGEGPLRGHLFATWREREQFGQKAQAGPLLTAGFINRAVAVQVIDESRGH